MSTLALTLERFFNNNNTHHSDLSDEIKESHESAIHAADVLGQAAYPPPGCNSHATLLKEGRASLDLNREQNSDSDPLDTFVILDRLNSQVRTSIDGMMEDNDRVEQVTGDPAAASLHDLAIHIRKKLRDVKSAIRYRLLVGKLNYDECSTPPYHLSSSYFAQNTHAPQAENEKLPEVEP